MAGEPFWFEKKFAGPIYGFPSDGKKYGMRRRNALKIKKKRVFLLAVLIVTAFSGCSANIVRKYPDSGVWYCEALHMKIDFSKTGHKNVKLYRYQVHVLCANQGNRRGNTAVSAFRTTNKILVFLRTDTGESCERAENAL